MNGETTIANTIATIMTILPTQTNCFSDISLAKYGLKTSSVKIVEILFALPANEATTAAVKAAKDSPFKPGGNKFNKTG